MVLQPQHNLDQPRLRTKRMLGEIQLCKSDLIWTPQLEYSKPPSIIYHAPISIILLNASLAKINILSKAEV
jgi:hypothetical protein